MAQRDCGAKIRILTGWGSGRSGTRVNEGLGLYPTTRGSNLVAAKWVVLAPWFWGHFLISISTHGYKVS
jgi:hypothetical protein